MKRAILRTLRILTAGLFLIALCLPTAGCLFGESREQREERIYVETIESIFAALDAGDAAAVYALFSEEAKWADSELEQDIARMMEVYEGPMTAQGFDGLLAGSYSIEPEGRTSLIYTTVPIAAGETYYWCYLRYTYECDPDPSQIGITELCFYTADEWCLFLYDEDTQHQDAMGLTVCADKTADGEVRCVYGNAFIYTDREAVDPALVVEQLDSTDSYAAFVNRFGEPAASHIYHYYPLPDENGEARYLCVGAVEEEDWIYGAFVVDRFGYIEEIWDNPREG